MKIYPASTKKKSITHLSCVVHFNRMFQWQNILYGAIHTCQNTILCRRRQEMSAVLRALYARKKTFQTKLDY